MDDEDDPRRSAIGPSDGRNDTVHLAAQDWGRGGGLDSHGGRANPGKNRREEGSSGTVRGSQAPVGLMSQDRYEQLRRGRGRNSVVSESTRNDEFFGGGGFGFFSQFIQHLIKP